MDGWTTAFGMAEHVCENQWRKVQATAFVLLCFYHWWSGTEVKPEDDYCMMKAVESIGWRSFSFGGVFFYCFLFSPPTLFGQDWGRGVVVIFLLRVERVCRIVHNPMMCLEFFKNLCFVVDICVV